jgi:hypothetical protein
MEATCSSETSVKLQRTTRRYIPEDNTLLKIVVQKYVMGTQWNTDAYEFLTHESQCVYWMLPFRSQWYQNTNCITVRSFKVQEQSS